MLFPAVRSQLPVVQVGFAASHWTHACRTWSYSLATSQTAVLPVQAVGLFAAHCWHVSKSALPLVVSHAAVAPVQLLVLFAAHTSHVSRLTLPVVVSQIVLVPLVHSVLLIESHTTQLPKFESLGFVSQTWPPPQPADAEHFTHVLYVGSVTVESQSGPAGAVVQFAADVQSLVLTHW